MKKFFLIGLAICLSLAMANAAHMTSTVNKTNNYLGFSLGLGADMMIPSNSVAKTDLGMDANFAFRYQLNSKGFLFTLGLGADYELTREKMNDYLEYRQAKDFDGENFRYEYQYSNYKDAQNTLYGMGMLALGYQVKQVYFLLGANVKLPLISNYHFTTDLLTSGAYSSFKAEHITDVPTYGFYPKDQYEGKGSKATADLVNLDNLWIAPMLEIGYARPIKKKSVLQAGLFLEYGIRLGDYSTPLFDYSKVATNMQIQSQENLRDNLQYGSLLYSAVPGLPNTNPYLGVDINQRDKAAVGSLSNFVLGLRVTLLFNVDHERKFCNCDPQNHTPIFHKRK